MKIKNRFLASVLCLLMGAFCIVGITACSDEENCSHQWGEWTTIKHATCTEAGIQEHECAECGLVESSSIIATGHIPNADDGDCTTAVTCSVCGQVAVEANASHTGGEATCKDKAVCSVCGKEYGELLAHTGEIVWMKHLDTHYRVYSCCYTQTSEAEEHTLVNGICRVCGFNPTIITTSREAAPGETVSIVVSVSDNPGITGLTAKIQYSADVLTLTEATSGAALIDLTFTAPSNLSSGCTFLWDGVEIKDENIKNGELLTLTFNISPNAPEGEYSILLEIRAYDNELNPLTFSIEGGKVIVKND